MSKWQTLSVLALMVSCSSAMATIYYVDEGGDSCVFPENVDGKSWAQACNSLADAIYSSASGDEIRVAQGTY